MPNYEDILNTAFPQHTYSNTIRALREGIAIGDDAVKGVPILDTPVGRDIRGLIRRAGVMSRLHELCQSGDLPFISEFSQMPIGSWHWLKLSSGECCGYLVRTPDKETFPADTPNQQDRRHSNQIELFEDPKVVPLSKAQYFSAWLCYGATRNGALTHALWGLPSGGEEENWLIRRDILNAVRATAPVTKNLEKPKVDPRQVMKLRDDVQKMIKDRDKAGREFGDEG